MNNSHAAKILATLLIGGVAVALILNEMNRSDDELETHLHYICLEETCGHEFEMSVREVASLAKHGESLRCPLCGSYSFKDAIPCVECGLLFKLLDNGALPPNCPHCDAVIGDWNPIMHNHNPDGTHVITDPEALERARAKREAKRATDEGE